MQNQQVMKQGVNAASVGLPLENAAAGLIKAAEDSIERVIETQSRVIYNKNHALLGNKASKNEQAPENNTPRPGKS